MPKDKTGGPAFPRAIGKTISTYNTAQEGMTLRDYFAGQALGIAIEYTSSSSAYEEASAKLAYKYADAMLAERKKLKETDDEI